jgi:hypothetical protein
MNYQVLICTCGAFLRYKKTFQRSGHRKDRPLLGIFPNFLTHFEFKKSPEGRDMKVIFPREAKDTEGGTIEKVTLRRETITGTTRVLAVLN